MNCDEARREIIAYLKNELDENQKRALEEHLLRCPNCRHELEGAQRLLAWTEAASEESIVKAVDGIIDDAISSSASDIHLESQRDNSLLVRIRIDGVLHDAGRFDSTQRAGILNRLKMMADVDISQTGIPQDGRMQWQSGGVDYDIRTCFAPYIYGECAELRIIDQRAPLLGLDKLYFSESDLAHVRRLIRLPMGMVISTGPVGSGKTTTIYSMLMEINSPDRLIVTIEDPVEYAIAGVNHSQVLKKNGYTFPVAVRAFMRQDPDVIMVGGMRDPETAMLSAQLAGAGHMVLSAMEVPDAVGVIQRLRDMGLENYVIAGTLAGVVAQRLVRRPCGNCSSPVTVDLNDPAVRFLGITESDLQNSRIMRGTGCEKCKQTGYRGRAAVYEVLEIDRRLAALIGRGATEEELLSAAKSSGFKTLVDDAREKVLAGVTTPEEAFRVLQ